MEQNSLKINPHTYGQLIFDKGGKTVQWRKNTATVYSPSGVGKATYKSMKLEHTKVNSKWLKDLKTRHNIVKLLEENVINYTNVFLGQFPKAIEIKAKTNRT